MIRGIARFSVLSTAVAAGIIAGLLLSAFLSTTPVRIIAPGDIAYAQTIVVES